MSDIAVTWAKAQDVRGADGKPDRNAKDTLVYLASYADAYGYAWAAVSVLSFEMSVDERQVQRGLAMVRCKPEDLDGFAEKTGKFHLHEGKRYPIYRLRIEKGPRNTLEARRVKRLSEVTPASPQETAEDISPDADVTPSAGLGDTGAAPTGDTGAAQIGKGTGNRETPVSPPRESAGEGEGLDFWKCFDAVGNAAPSALKTATKWSAARSAWAKATKKTKPEAILTAMVAYAADPNVSRRFSLPGLEIWLAEEMFRPFLTKDESAVRAVVAAASQPLLAGAPTDVLDVVATRGKAWATSWLNGAVWREDLQAIVTKLGFQAANVSKDIGAELKRLNVRVVSASELQGA